MKKTKRKKNILSRKRNGLTLQRAINYLITDYVNEDTNVAGQICEESTDMLRVRIIKLYMEYL